MEDETFDLVVIGGGSGGVRAARLAAERGQRVALIEARHLGGTCVNVGCVPKKLYHHAARYGHAAQEAQGYGWTRTAGPGGWALDWERLKQGRADEIARLRGIYEHNLRQAGVQIHQGWARLRDAHTVDINGRHLRAKHILVATGGQSVTPDIPGRELGVTSDAMFDLPAFPRRLAVVGGGYIACEMASIFHGLGAQVTLLQRGPQLLTGFDTETAQHLAGELRRQGIRIELEAALLRLEATPDGMHQAQWKDALGHRHKLEADVVLLATGRQPATPEALGLAAAGVATGDDGRIDVDARQTSNVPSIHAIGDVTSRLSLTPIAIAEAMAFIDHLYGPAAGRAPREVAYAYTPTAVFTHPAVGQVGYSEQEARETFGAIDVYRSDFVGLEHALTGSGQRSLVKLIVARASARVVGLHVVGADAAEIVQGFAVAMNMGATKADFDATTGLHPTVAEELVTLKTPARQWD